MDRLIKQIHGLLIRKKMTVSTAESCTGGLLGEYLTCQPGSSKYFLLGVITYSNKAKNAVLKISLRAIRKNGAVSKETAILMAAMVKKMAGSDIGIGITGIAGPTGAVPGKPVGTVFIAVKCRSFGICKRFCFKGNRAAVRKKAALKALELLYASLYCH